MDLEKIGKYIETKRKALGITQVQLAERLGMNDKSVSKWERGICLPDVSVYMELCEILGISTKTGYRILREGKICCLKVGRAYRIPKAHLFTYLAIGQQETQSS